MVTDVSACRALTTNEGCFWCFSLALFSDNVGVCCFVRIASFDDEWTDFQEVAIFFISCSSSKDERAGLCRQKSNGDWYRDDECKSDGHEAILVKVEDDQRRRLRANPEAKMTALATGMRMLGNGNGKTPPGQERKGGNTRSDPPGLFKKMERSEDAITRKIDGKNFVIFPNA